MIKNVKIMNILLEDNNRTYQDGYDDDFYDDDYNQFDGYDDVSSEDEESNLEYLIRTFLTARGIKSYVETSGKDVVIYVYLQKKEKIRNLTKIFDVMINHMQVEMFEGYDLETELYESKEGDNIFSFSFYSDGVKEDDYDAPF
jgi:hypothetical protein